MITRHYIVSLITLLLLGPLPSLGQQTKKTIEIRGVYGNPKPLWDKGHNLNDLGVNAIFVHGNSITSEMVDTAKKQNARVFAEFATLNGKGYVNEHPEAWAINEKGEQVTAASWFMGVCPTDPGFQKYRMDQLRELLGKFELDGVWMDYVHWHAQFEDPEPILPETCFSDSCLNNFSKDFNITIPQGTTAEKAQWILQNKEKEWRDWRCSVLHSWAVEMKKIITEKRPDALLGLYHSPWTDTEFNGAQRRILGIDYDLLKETIDVFSPMVYHGRMGRKPEWVAENIEWLCNRLDIKNDTYPKVWPIVQAHNDPNVITETAFKIVLKGGLASEATGVMMFTTNSVAEDQGKLKIMRDLYRQIDSVQSSY